MDVRRIIHGLVSVAVEVCVPRWESNEGRLTREVDGTVQPARAEKRRMQSGEADGGL